MIARLNRSYGFAASHRLFIPSLSDAENVELFGKCANPFGHGHDYRLTITVEGPIDETTGLVMNIAALDAFMEQTVMRSFRHCNLNCDLPEFRTLVPTTENLTLVAARRLDAAWSGLASPRADDSAPSLAAVHVQETARNGFTLALSQKGSRSYA